MQLRILGTAAGGGFPQWNCNCPCCAEARKDGNIAPERMHASIAVSASLTDWYLVNATPDIRQQIESFKELQAGPGLRDSPVKGVLLTDAEFDHTIGLLVIREGSQIEIYGTEPILNSLENNFPIKNMLKDYASFDWVKVSTGKEFSIDQGKIKVVATGLSNKPPKYVSTTKNGSGSLSGHSDWVIAYNFTDALTGKRILFAPQVSKIEGELRTLALEADYLFIDGTCSYNDEIPNLGISQRTSKDMGHLPLFEVDGIINGINDVNSARQSAGKKPLESYLIHINNTNPILKTDSKEFKKLAEHNIRIAPEGELLSL